jgi:hypothetical protein
MIHEAFSGAKPELTPPLPIKKDPKYARYSRKLTGKYAEPLRPEEMQFIEDWARVGVPDTEIAHGLDFSLKSFNEALQNTPGILTRLTKARAAGNIEIYDALHRIAKAGSVPALIWLSRTRLGQGKDIVFNGTNGATFPGTSVSTDDMEERIEFCRQLREAIFAPEPEPLPPTKPANAHEVEATTFTVEPPPISPQSKN